MNTVEYDKLKITIRYWLYGKAENDKRYYATIEAFNVAMKYHNGYRKDNVTKEFYHQLNMVSYLRTLVSYFQNAPDVLTLALLHDTFEDYPESHIELHDKFPWMMSKLQLISKMVDGKKLSNEEYYGNMVECPETVIVKVVDRIHNLSTMNGVFSESKIQDYIAEVHEFFLPMIKTMRRDYPELEPVFELLKSTMLLVVASNQASINKLKES